MQQERLAKMAREARHFVAEAFLVTFRAILRNCWFIIISFRLKIGENRQRAERALCVEKTLRFSLFNILSKIEQRIILSVQNRVCQCRLLHCAGVNHHASCNHLLGLQDKYPPKNVLVLLVIVL